MITTPLKTPPWTFRRSTWFNEKTKKPMFGIEAKRIGTLGGKWMDCKKDGHKLVFKTEQRRDAALEAMRKKEREKFFNTSNKTK